MVLPAGHLAMGLAPRDSGPPPRPPPRRLRSLGLQLLWRPARRLAAPTPTRRSARRRPRPLPAKKGRAAEEMPACTWTVQDGPRGRSTTARLCLNALETHTRARQPTCPPASAVSAAAAPGQGRPRKPRWRPAAPPAAASAPRAASSPAPARAPPPSSPPASARLCEHCCSSATSSSGGVAASASGSTTSRPGVISQRRTESVNQVWNEWANEWFECVTGLRVDRRGRYGEPAAGRASTKRRCGCVRHTTPRNTV
jgi:hypothetical protein